MQSFVIPDFSAVKRVKGTQPGANSANWLHKLSFMNKDGTEITKVELADKKPYGPEFELDDSEQIIGICGAKDQDYRFLQLGFIFW